MKLFKKVVAVLCLAAVLAPVIADPAPVRADTSMASMVSFFDQSLSAKGFQAQNVSRENKERAIQFMKDHQVPEETMKAFIAADPDQALHLQWTASGMAGDNGAVLKMVESFQSSHRSHRPRS